MPPSLTYLPRHPWQQYPAPIAALWPSEATNESVRGGRVSVPNVACTYPLPAVTCILKTSALHVLWYARGAEDRWSITVSTTTYWAVDARRNPLCVSPVASASLPLRSTSVTPSLYAVLRPSPVNYATSPSPGISLPSIMRYVPRAYSVIHR